MLEFAVRVKGVHNVEDGQSGWVLAVDPTAGVLIEHADDKSLHWHALADCTFAGMVKPGAPQPVYLMQPAQPAGKPHPLVVPGRAARRELARNGPG